MATTFAELAASSMARTGGVNAQLQMGRDKINQAQFAAQQAAQQNARDYAAQQDLAKMQFDREKQAQQQANWEANFGATAAQREQAQGNLDRQFGVTTAQEGRAQQEFELEQMEKQREQDVMGAMSGMSSQLDMGYWGSEEADAVDAQAEAMGWDDAVTGALHREREKIWNSMNKPAGAISTSETERTRSRLLELSRIPPEQRSPDEQLEFDIVSDEMDVIRRGGGQEFFSKKGLVQDDTGRWVSAGGVDESLAGREEKIKYAGKWGELSAAREDIPLTEEAKRLATNLTAYKDFEATIPSMFNTIDKLKTLAQVANYSKGQKISDATRAELQAAGFGNVSDGLTARAAYDNFVKTTVLPNLKQMLGAQFTAVEGQWVLDTFGGTEMTPQEKTAALDAKAISYLNDMRTKALAAGLDPNDSENFRIFLNTVDDESAFTAAQQEYRGGTAAGSGGARPALKSKYDFLD